MWTIKTCGKAHARCSVCLPEVKTAHHQNRGRKIIGRKMPPISQEHRENLAEAQRKAWAEGRKVAPNGPLTGIQQKLIAFLRAAGYEGLKMEVPFGRYRVDVYVASRHLAFEADGEAWHERHPFRDQVSKDIIRDEYLLREFSLPTVRLTGSEIEELMPCKPEHASKTEKEEARKPLPAPAPVREPELVGAR
jgi:very-short-patch-repair endonuclease